MFLLFLLGLLLFLIGLGWGCYVYLSSKRISGKALALPIVITLVGCGTVVYTVF